MLILTIVYYQVNQINALMVFMVIPVLFLVSFIFKSLEENSLKKKSSNVIPLTRNEEMKGHPTKFLLFALKGILLLLVVFYLASIFLMELI